MASVLDVPAPTFKRPGRILVVGGANLDLKARLAAPPVAGTSNPASILLSAGGVGRNIAHALALLGEQVALLSAVGRDGVGEEIVRATEASGVDCSLMVRTPGPTGTYVAALDPGGELVLGLSGMEAMAALTPDLVAAYAPVIRGASLVVADCNVAPRSLVALGRTARDAGVPLVVEPVSVAKATHVLALIEAGIPIALLTPNRDELAALTGERVEDGGQASRAATLLHERGVDRLIVGLGPHGALVSDGPQARLVPPVAGSVADVTGGGDVATACAIHALRRGRSLAEAAVAGQRAARAAVASTETVPAGLPELFADLHP